MKKPPVSFGSAIALLLIGSLLGSVFTFGMQYWNEKASRSDCVKIETQFVAYKEHHQPKHLQRIKQITIYCTNDERYSIDGASITDYLRNALSELSPKQKITLLIHPNSNTIVELSTDDEYLMKLDKTNDALAKEATGFLYLGYFMFFCAIVGLYYTILYSIKRIKHRR